MALSAKQHILKLRETEYKLQKLQNNLLNINKDDATMSEFLAHHKELMALPGSNRDSVPFRFSFEAPKRYVEMKQEQKLTLPPKIPLRSANRLSRYRDTFDSDEMDRSEQTIGHRSKALHSLLNELEKQASKMVIAFPKLDKLTLLNKTPFLRSLQNSKHNYFNTGNPTKKLKASSKSKGFTSAPVTTNVSKLSSKASISKTKAKKLKMMWNKKISNTASTATTELIFPEASKEYEKKLDQNGNIVPGSLPDKSLTKQAESEKTGENLAYALEASNLMGVILPPQPSQSKNRGPNAWTSEKKSTVSVSGTPAPATAASDIDDSENISAKEAMTILRRRKFPERKSHFPERKSPHERGLIGIEISNFEPQCAFFYRDRNGNYNPHLYHSKNITDGLKKAKPRRNNAMKHSLG